MFLLQCEFYSAAPGIPRSPNRTQGLVGIPRSKKKNYFFPKYSMKMIWRCLE